MKSNWQILANVSGYTKKYLLTHNENILIRPSDAIDAMGTVIQRTLDECKKKKK